MSDQVNSPAHYAENGPACDCGRRIECIQIARLHSFSLGNSLKYIWRAGFKSDPDKTGREKQIEDLQKARWYLADEIARLQGEA